jgi:hypothetical protein
MWISAAGMRSGRSSVGGGEGARHVLFQRSQRSAGDQRVVHEDRRRSRDPQARPRRDVALDLGERLVTPQALVEMRTIRDAGGLRQAGPDGVVQGILGEEGVVEGFEAPLPVGARTLGQS